MKAWISQAGLARYRQPRPFYRWFTYHGSLTQRLQTFNVNQVHIELIRQSWQIPYLTERRYLNLKARQLVWAREVYIYVKQERWLYARTVIPQMTLNGKYRHLQKWDDTAIGEFLFRQPHLQRSAFEFALLKTEDKYVQAAYCNVASSQKALWARRSRFELDHKPLLITEVFLPTGWYA